MLLGWCEKRPARERVPRTLTDKIVVSAGEITGVTVEPVAAPRIEPKLAPAIPWWARLAMSPLVLFLPLLSIIAIILRVAFRTQPPRTRHAWTAFVSTLLIISGFLTSIASVLVFSFAPIPAIVSTGLSDLDERTEFPELPSKAVLTGSDAAQQLKTLVAVISPPAARYFGNREMPSNSFGAGMLLQANSSGYLFATARHVVGEGGANLEKDRPRALVALASGVWAGATVIARHTSLDLVLLWLPRHSGKTEFVQPIAAPKEGESIYVIGHPEGLKFTLSTGIISRMENSMLQISAPVSPGNSGGPVYDQQGNLVGVVNATMDKNLRPNAENLNFAVSAQAIMHESGWDFVPGGRERLQEFWRAETAAAKPSPLSQSQIPQGAELPTGLKTNGHD
jgi:S1-C subfamily serine protease